MAQRENIQVRVSVISDEALKNIGQLEQQAARISSELKQMKKGSEEYVQASARLDEVNGKLSKVRGQYDLMGRPLQSLTKESAQLNREIMRLTPGTEQFIAKTQRLQAVNGRIGTLRKEMRGAQASMKGLATEAAMLNPMSASVMAVANQFGLMRGKLAEAAKGMQLLKVAIASTGIGLLIVALGTLYQWFQKNQTGVELWRKGLAIGGAVIDAVTERAFRFIEGIGLAGKAVYQFISGDWTAAAETAAGASDKFKESSEGFWDNIKGDVSSAVDAEERLIALEKAENQFALTQAKRKKEIQELIFLTRDRTKSFDEQKEALEQANELELANLNDTIALQKERLAIAQQEYDRAESDEKDFAALQQERIRLEELETQSLSRQRELKNRMNELENKRLADEKKAIQERNKLKAEELKFEQELEDLKIEIMEDGEEKEIARLNAQYDRKIKAIADGEHLATERRAALETERQHQIDALREQFAEEELDKELERLELDEEAKKLALEEKFQQLLITEQQRDEALYQLQRGSLERELQLISAAKGSKSAEYQALYGELLALDADHNAKKVENTERTEKLTADVRRQGLSAAKGIMQVGIELLGQDEEARKKHASAIKAFTIGKILADLASEIAGYFTTKESKLTLGAVGAIKAAVATARATLSISKVAKQKFATGGVFKAARRILGNGGFLTGPSHEQRGMPVINPITGDVEAEVEGGEVILSKKTVQNNPVIVDRLLDSSMNKGGAPIMEDGGGFMPSAGTGSPTAPAEMPGPTANSAVERELKISNQLMNRMITAFEAYPKNIKAHIVNSELERNTERLQEDENEATL